jgi:arylformamidase
MLSWPTDPPIVFHTFKSQEQGDASNVIQISFGSHTGSHIDAPKHFISNGRSVDQLPLEVLIGNCRVFQLDNENGRTITAADLERLNFTSIDRVLFKTANSKLWEQPSFNKEFIAFDETSARFLIRQRLRLVGIDYLSVDKYGSREAPVHHLLLGSGIVVVEGLDLRAVPPGDYQLFCLPLRIKNGDGAPARVILKATGS